METSTEQKPAEAPAEKASALGPALVAIWPSRYAVATGDIAEVRVPVRALTGRPSAGSGRATRLCCPLRRVAASFRWALACARAGVAGPSGTDYIETTAVAVLPTSRSVHTHWTWRRRLCSHRSSALRSMMNVRTSSMTAVTTKQHSQP